MHNKLAKIAKYLITVGTLGLLNGGLLGSQSGVSALPDNNIEFYDNPTTVDFGGGYRWNLFFEYIYTGYFPFVYVFNNSEWIYIAPNSSESAGYFFFAFNNGHWCWTKHANLGWFLDVTLNQWGQPYKTIPSGEYLVIDISGGTDAATYPVTTMTMATAPMGGLSDEYKTTKLLLRRIPAGTFTMGSPSDEVGRNGNETQHQVTLTKDFYIGVFEVTQRQWELVMGNKPSYFNNVTYYANRPVEQVSYYEIRENPNNSDDSTSNWPANRSVNATSFVGKLREKAGLNTIDLPTEAQWEYACRAGTPTALNSGKNLATTGNDANIAEVGRYWFNGGSGSTSGSGVEASSGSAYVGSYKPNAWGLYDMHGNVWEWCLDWYDSYTTAAVTDPVGTASESFRVVRGGGWDYFARHGRSAYRYYSVTDNRDSGIGVRLALSSAP